MATREECLQKAEEAEHLARIVSFGPDRARLTAQSDRWRALADQPATPATDKSKLHWLLSVNRNAHANNQVIEKASESP